MGVKACSEMLLMLCSFAIISQYIYKHFLNNRKRGKRREIHDAIFFSTDDKIQNKSKNFHMTDSLSKLCYYLNTSRYTLDLCMFAFTSKDLYYVILKLHHKGVQVRIIADAEMAYCSGSVVRKLEKAGVPLRWIKSTNIMHNKFCIIDANSKETTPLLITGSLNWTAQALYGNWENVLVTSQEQIVNEYKNAFYKLWEQFKPIV